MCVCVCVFFPCKSLEKKHSLSKSTTLRAGHTSLINQESLFFRCHTPVSFVTNPSTLKADMRRPVLISSLSVEDEDMRTGLSGVSVHNTHNVVKQGQISLIQPQLPPLRPSPHSPCHHSTGQPRFIIGSRVGHEDNGTHTFNPAFTCHAFSLFKATYFLFVCVP